MDIHKSYNNNLLVILLSIFPIALISGPVVPEIYCLLSVIFFIFRFRDILKFYKKKELLFFLVLYLSINLSSFFNPDIFFSLKKSVPLFRVFFFSSCIVFFLVAEEKLKILLFYVITLIVILLFLDSIFQLIFGYNISGLKLDPTGRISSFFGDELIMGGYIVKIMSIYLCLAFFIKNSAILRYNLIVILLALATILLSGERTATIQFIGIILVYSFVFFNFKRFLVVIIGCVVLLFSFYSLNNKSSQRIFSHTIYQFNQTNNILYPSFRHFMHYQTAIQIFLENKFFGSGVKSFRLLCGKEKYLTNIVSNLPEKYLIKKNYNGYIKGYTDEKEKKLIFYKDDIVESYDNINYPIYFFENSYEENDFNENYINDINVEFKKGEPIYVKFDLSGRCNTHPHNIYLQVLSETGLFGFILFMVIILNTFKISILLFFKKIKKNLSNIEKSQFMINTSLLVLLFPILPHPSLFNNWSLIFLSFIFSFKIYTGILIKNK